jgi:hypothetical protein
VRSDSKLLRDIKFLEEVKRAALDQKDLEPPYDRPELMQSMMFAVGVVQVLVSRGYKIEKDE